MAFLNFWKGSGSTTNGSPPKKLNITTGLRLEDADVDVLFISQDNQVVFVNDKVDHLFVEDRDGDKQLEGRVVNIVFRSKNSVIETFVAFDESDSYALFTMGIGRQERLDWTAKCIFQYFSKNAFHKLFSAKEKYATQCIYAFKIFQKGRRYFMVNSQQSAAYLIDGSVIKREGVDKIKEEFWGNKS